MTTTVNDAGLRTSTLYAEMRAAYEAMLAVAPVETTQEMWATRLSLAAELGEDLPAEGREHDLTLLAVIADLLREVRGGPGAALRRRPA